MEGMAVAATVGQGLHSNSNFPRGGGVGSHPQVCTPLNIQTIYILYKAKGEGKAMGREAGLKPSPQYVKAHPACLTRPRMVHPGPSCPWLAQSPICKSPPLPGWPPTLSL